jgi:acyl-CoA thioester hydrolase
MSHSKFTTDIIVRSYDLDSYGHVNNAVYLNYLEAARCDLMNQVGMSFNEFKQWEKFPVVADAHLHYRAPAYADDVLTVKTTLAEMRKASFQMTYEIVNQHGALVLEAEMEFLFLKPNGRPTRVPQAFSDAFMADTSKAQEDQ